MVEIFKTNVRGRANAHMAEAGLMLLDSNLVASFDLGDPENILRVESEFKVDKQAVILYFKELGYFIQTLI